MDIRGTTNIPARPKIVWEALNDPVVLAQCIDGSASFEQVGPREFAATGSLRVGPVRSGIAVNIAIAESDPPDRAVLHLNARGAMGCAEAIAIIHLAASDGGTRLDYEATANLGGRLGRLAGRWADDAVHQLVSDFFTRFAAAIPAAFPAVTTESVAARPSPATAAPTTTRATSTRTKALWIGIGAATGAAITAAAAFLLSRNRSR